MPPKKKTGAAELVPIQFRFPKGLIAALDAAVDRENRIAVGPQWTRSDLVRRILEVSLASPDPLRRGDRRAQEFIESTLDTVAPALGGKQSAAPSKAPKAKR